jgi:hypothetical protein
MKVDSFKCDGCGIQKGANNHWFIVSAVDLSIHVSAWVSDAHGWDHYCSDACVIKAVQRWLSAQKEASQKEMISEEEK